ncbi:hypothetical protein [Geminicoccus harenae]|uniref:hypothetical protein n=1 Tax=Geminicoccus harenae TaxID=2498453 RepID=UPI001C975FB5|nr:hypothetical protein [Geminicoccus harenae]
MLGGHDLSDAKRRLQELEHQAAHLRQIIVTMEEYGLPHLAAAARMLLADLDLPLLRAREGSGWSKDFPDHGRGMVDGTERPAAWK